MLILLFNESKAPSVSTCNQIQTFFVFFFLSGKICECQVSPAHKRPIQPITASDLFVKTPSLAVCTSTRRCCGTVPDEMNEQMFSDCRATNWWLGSLWNACMRTHARFCRSCLCPPWLDVALSAVIYSLMAEPKTQTWLDCASHRLKTTSKWRRSGACVCISLFLGIFFFFFFF